MPVWLIPFIIVDVIAGIAAGLLISYYILKRQNKSFPLFQFFQKKSVKTEVEVEPIAEKQAEPAAAAEETPKQNSPATPISPPVVQPPVDSNNTALVQELENNLEIASRPTVEKLVKFQLEVWNVRQSSLNSTESPFQNELSDAYLDMQLANNIVWLVTDLGHDSPDFRAGYSELKKKIVLRLKRVLPKVKSP